MSFTLPAYAIAVAALVVTWYLNDKIDNLVTDLNTTDKTIIEICNNHTNRVQDLLEERIGTLEHANEELQYLLGNKIK